MSPELRQLQAEVRALQARLKAFESLAQLDPQIIRTIAAASSANVVISSKGATSENRNVNEAGAASYSVLNPPDRFVLLGGQNIPAYDL